MWRQNLRTESECDLWTKDRFFQRQDLRGSPGLSESLLLPWNKLMGGIILLGIYIMLTVLLP